MKTEYTFCWLKRAMLLAGFMMFASPPLAQAQSVSVDQIIEALKPEVVTRGLSTGARATTGTEDSAFLDSLRNRTRSLSIGERDKLAEIAKDKRSIDLEIPFEFNSSTIGPKALPTIKKLGAALLAPELKGSTFMIAGHTDAKGNDDYNQALSERRAEAVKRYLVENLKIGSENLASVGYGESRLKNPANPLADENRRVEVTNLSAGKTTSR